MRRILKSKRGAALEGALLFMMVIFMLAMLLTSVVMNAHLRVRVNDMTIQNEVKIEYIGMQFVKGDLSTGELPDGYYADINAENTTLKLTKANKVVLQIEVKIQDDGKREIVKWTYSAK